MKKGDIIEFTNGAGKNETYKIGKVMVSKMPKQTIASVQAELDWMTKDRDNFRKQATNNFNRAVEAEEKLKTSERQFEAIVSELNYTKEALERARGYIDRVKECDPKN